MYIVQIFYSGQNKLIKTELVRLLDLEAIYENNNNKFKLS